MNAVGKTVSVVIATYNGSVFIRTQLDSVVNQTFKPLEIIVSDDGSTDDTLAIVRAMAAECSIPIIVKTNTVNLGFRDNFLTASLAARGDFIAFCDQDDIWDPTKLELAARHFHDRNISLVVHSAASLEQSTGRLVEFSQGIRRAGIKPPLSYDPWLTFFGFSIIFRRELLHLASIEGRFRDFIVPKEKIAHDRWIMFLGQVVGETAELDLPLVKYRQHDGNLFGDGRRGRKAKVRGQIEVFDDYMSATASMIDVVRNLPDDTKADFPLFDRDRAIRFFERALHQLERRRSVYVAGSRLLSLGSVIANFRTGVYRSVHSDAVRWRSIARDLKHCVVRG